MGDRMRGLLALGDRVGFLPARSCPLPRAPRGEDDLLGFCDDQMRLCFALAL